MPRPEWRTSFRALNTTQFLGALNDNLFKLAIILLAKGRVEGICDREAFDFLGMNPEALAMAVFTVPFVLLGAFAGSLADRLPKPWILKRLKLTEVLVMAAATAAFVLGSSWALLVTLLLMGTQSAFFGPPKYGAIPEILPHSELSRGNAQVQAATYAAIIGGTAAAGVMIEELGPSSWVIGPCCVLVALLGWLASDRIAPIPAADPVRALRFDPVRSVARDLAAAARDRELLVALLLGALFLHVAGLVVLAIVTYVEVLDVKRLESSTALLNATMGVGIVVGSLLAGRWSRGRVESGLVPLGAAGVAGCLFALSLPVTDKWVAASLFMGAGISAGLFLVPLRSLVQDRPKAHEKGRFMGTAQVLDFTALLVASGVYHLFAESLGLSPRARMAAIAAIIVVGALALFSFSGRYLQRVVPLLRGC